MLDGFLANAIFSLGAGHASTAPLLVGGVLLLRDKLGVCANVGVNLLVQGLQVVAVDSGGDKLGKALLVQIVVGLQQLHVGGNVSSENVLAELGSVELVLLLVVSDKALGRVRDGESSVDGTLEGGKELGAGGGGLESDVEQGGKGAHRLVDGLAVALAADLFAVGGLGVEKELAGGGLDALVLGVEAELLEQTAGEQQAGAVGGGVVGEADSEAVARIGQLARVGGTQHAVALDGGVDNLRDDVLVGEAHHKAILGSVVLVLVLNGQTTTSLIVSLALASATILHLKPLEIGLVLDNFHESHDRLK